MKCKSILFIVSLAALSLGFGCVSKSWTQEQLKAANKKAEQNFQQQNAELNGKYSDLLAKNKDLYRLLDKLFNENENLYANCKTLKQRLDRLEKSISTTQTKVKKDVIAFVRKNDMKVYKYVTAEQQKHINELNVSMGKVEKADKEAKKLREVIVKIQKAYKKAK